MSAPYDPSTLDLNGTLRRALHERDTNEALEPYLRRAVEAAVPAEAAAAVTAGLLRTIERAAAELGGTSGEAAHSVLANIGRFHFNFDWTGGTPSDSLGDDSWVVLQGRLRRFGDLREPERSRFRPAAAAPPSALSSPAPARGGCLGLVLLLITIAAWIAVAGGHHG